MPAGPAKLALDDRCGAAAGALLVRTATAGASVSTADGHVVRCVGAITQALADRFAAEHRRAPRRLAHAAAAVARRPVRRSAGRGCSAEIAVMRIGMVCPYSFDVPGGVQAHVLQLAEVLHRARARRQRAGARVRRHVELPDFVVSGGRAVADPVQRIGGAAERSAPPPTAGPAVAHRQATSTCCTSTSRTRRACRCSR